MKLIKQSFSAIPQESGLEGIYKQIELAGRTCYKSEDKITEDSAKGFVDRMIKSKHYAMLEHGTVYLERDVDYSDADYNTFESLYEKNPYSKVTFEGGICYVTTNFRVLVENGWMDDLQYLCEPTEYHEKRITVRFITDQGILREFTRHRVFSFAVESTRYCNYSKNKFGKKITFIEPIWFNNSKWYQKLLYKFSMKYSSWVYKFLIKSGWKPQQARNVLPLATKCDMVMTGFISDWNHFFGLRSNKYGTGGAHPQASELADALYEYLK